MYQSCHILTTISCSLLCRTELSINHLTSTPCPLPPQALWGTGAVRQGFNRSAHCWIASWVSNQHWDPLSDTNQKPRALLTPSLLLWLVNLLPSPFLQPWNLTLQMASIATRHAPWPLVQTVVFKEGAFVYPRPLNKHWAGKENGSASISVHFSLILFLFLCFSLFSR